MNVRTFRIPADLTKLESALDTIMHVSGKAMRAERRARHLRDDKPAKYRRDYSSH